MASEQHSIVDQRSRLHAHSKVSLAKRPIIMAVEGGRISVFEHHLLPSVRGIWWENYLSN